MSPSPPGSVDPALGSSTLPPGSRIGGHYRVLDGLGRPGGFGQTYRALDEHLHREVAIKEYFPRELVARSAGDATVRPLGTGESAKFEFGKLRFLEEGRTLARISHPRVVRVLELFEGHRTAYLVMEYHRGANLAEVAALAEGRLPERIVVALLAEVLEGLEAVHRQGILHCDVKPSNLYLTQAGVPLLLDFGAARRDFGERTATLDGVLSPGYAPFELFQERGRLGPWTDVYGVAATAVALLTGERPPSATDRMAADPLAADGALAARLPEELRAPLVAALRLQPEARTASAAQFRAELLAAPIAEGDGSPVSPASHVELAELATRAMARLAADEEAGTGSSTTTIPRPSERRRRARSARPLLAAALAIVAASALTLYWRSREPPAPSDSLLTAPASLAMSESSGGTPEAVPVVLAEAAASSATASIPAGEVLLAIVPFGEIVEVRDPSGRELAAASSVPLPALLRFPAGEWTVKVRYPVTGEVVALPLSISGGQTLRVEHRFAQLEARAYFEATGW